MCSVWKSDDARTQGEPTLEEWYRFINQLGDLTNNSVVINVAGGEPLLDDRNLALINFSAKRGLFTSMPTNGFLIDNQMAHKISESCLNEIEISLDGINKDTHDFLRGVEGCYEKAMQAIDYLDRCRGNLKIAIIAIIMEKNLDETAGLAEFVNQDKRIEAIIFQAVAQPFNTPLDHEWYKKSAYSFIWPQDLTKVCSVIDELIRLKKIGYKISNPVSQLEVFKRYFADPADFIKAASCNVDFYMNINQFGDVYMCPHKNAIGNIKKDSPRDMWYGQAANKIREEIRNCGVNCHHLLNCCYEEEPGRITPAALSWPPL
jgi:MoaA/NifB/PqqE/SkfB family radical SAM enzyme